MENNAKIIYGKGIEKFMRDIAIIVKNGIAVGLK